MGKRKYTEKEKEEVKKKRYQDRKKEYQDRKKNGQCKHCNDSVCEDSHTFCETHLNKHREYCRKAELKRTRNSSKYSKLKGRSKQRGISFDLDKVEFEKWMSNQPKECFYCGIKEAQLKDSKDNKKKKLTIDRKNNDIGYKIDNICLACFRCNNAKSYFFTFEEWTYIADQMIKPRFKEYHKSIFG